MGRNGLGFRQIFKTGGISTDTTGGNMKNFKLCKNCNQISEFRYNRTGYICLNCNNVGNNSNSIQTVLGHLCSGLESFQIEGQSSTCIPQFSNDGFISGCDDTNSIKILFCPFCGIQLPKIETEDMKGGD